MRRLFLSTLIIALSGVWSPSEAVAEKRMIAVIMADSQPRYNEVHSAFVEKSADFCAQDCRIYVQTPNADILSLRNAVRKAVALGTELIVTYGPLATLAAKAELPPVPTVFADVCDPVGLGLVSAVAQTGRNMTGIRGDAPVQGLLKYFSDTVDVRKLAIFYDAKSPEAVLQKQVLEESGKRRDIVTVAMKMDDAQNYMAALGALPDDVDGVFVGSSEHPETNLNYVFAYTSARKIPVITQLNGAADKGAFMVLETSAREQGEKLAEMVGQLLAGRDIKQIPMRKPHGISFVINLKLAREFGIKVPIQTLSVASRVIR